MPSAGPKPRPNYLGRAEHTLEHGEEEVVHEDELVGTSAHGRPDPDLRAEEPFGETRGSTETS